MDDYYEIVNDFYKHRFPLYTREIPRFGLPVRAKDRILYAPFVYHKPKFYYPYEEWEISVIPRTLYQKWFDPNDKDAKKSIFEHLKKNRSRVERFRDFCQQDEIV